jgi:hypothetical protein
MITREWWMLEPGDLAGISIECHNEKCKARLTISLTSSESALITACGACGEPFPDGSVPKQSLISERVKAFRAALAGLNEIAMHRPLIHLIEPANKATPAGSG